MIAAIVTTLIAAAAVDAVEDFGRCVAADRSFDAGEWSDARRPATPAWVDAACDVVHAAGWVDDAEAWS